MCVVETMMIAGTALSAAGTIAGGISARQAGQANAAAMEQQAVLREQKAAYDIERVTRRFNQEEGKLLTGVAASGVSAASFYDVLADNAAEFAVEKDAIRFGATADATNIRSQAQIQRQQGQAAFIGSLFSAAGAVTTGYGRVGAYRARDAAVGARYGSDY